MTLKRFECIGKIKKAIDNIAAAAFGDGCEIVAAAAAAKTGTIFIITAVSKN